MEPEAVELEPEIKESAPRMAQIMELLWQQVRPRLVADYQNKRKLAKVWA